MLRSRVGAGRKQQVQVGSPWGDICPDILSSIYEKLPPNPGAGRLQFRSVCKNWRQIPHRHAEKSPASRAPLKPAMSAEIPSKIREELSCACIRYVSVIVVISNRGPAQSTSSSSSSSITPVSSKSK